jgi:site-specific DNA-methyltransferase (adenine-specific)
MCGSGTTLIAAKTHNRSFIGVDISETAIELAEKRLKSVIISRSVVTKEGRSVFEEKVNSKNEDVAHILDTLNINMVYRNKNIDGYLKKTPNGKPVAVRVVGYNEDYMQVRKGFQEALKKTRSSYGILISDNDTKHNGTSQLAFVDQTTEDKIPVVEIGLEEVVKNPLTIYQIRPEI